jgi:hypothetical protein
VGDGNSFSDGRGGEGERLSDMIGTCLMN